MEESAVDAKIDKMMNAILVKFSDMLNENTTRLAALVDSKLKDHSQFYEEKFFRKSVDSIRDVHGILLCC